MLTVSVIIASYKRPELLSACLAAIGRQTTPALETLVSAVAGDGATAQAVEAAGTALPGIKLVLNSLPDIAAHEREAITVAAGDVIAFIDDDAVAPEDWLARLLAHYADPHVGGVGGPCIPVWNGQAVRRHTDTVGRFTWYGGQIGNHDCVTDDVKHVDFLRGCNMSLRREPAGELDHRLLDAYYGWEDDLCCRVRAAGLDLLFDPTIEVLHYTKTSEDAERMFLDPRFVSTYYRNKTTVTLANLGLVRSVLYLLMTGMLMGSTRGLFGTVRSLFRRQEPAGQTIRLCAAATAGRLAGIRAIMGERRSG